MCLIIHGPSALIRRTLLNTPGLIDNIYEKNGDGLGVMYAGSSGLRVRKWLPRNAAKARRLIAALPDDGRELAMHWRWRTHGDIDKANCHPYQVGPDYVMHNGVLDTGNAADPSKSDTWHYCQQFLAGGLLSREAHEPAFQRLVEHHIGAGNKLVVLTSDGRMSIIGRSRGIELAGLWWSNTYAWNPKLADPAWVDPNAARYACNSLWSRLNTINDLYGPDYSYTDEYVHQDDEQTESPEDDYLPELWVQLLDSGDADSIAELLTDEPYTALATLFRQGWSVKRYGNSDDPYGFIPLILSRDAFALARECRSGRAAYLASTLAFDTEWTHSPSEHATSLQPALISA